MSIKIYKKIDLYYNGDYLCSTNQSKSCKEAVKNYIERITYYAHYNNLVDSQILKNPKLLKAFYDNHDN